MQIAGETLSLILSCTAGQLACTKLSEQERNLLLLFCDTQSTVLKDIIQDNESNIGSFKKEDIDPGKPSDPYWKTESKTFDEWITTVTPYIISLLPENENIMLRSCFKLTQMRPELAEKMFGFCVWQLIIGMNTKNKASMVLVRDMINQYEKIFKGDYSKIESRIIEP
eukprot:UN03991